jgi:hypothetical protein
MVRSITGVKNMSKYILAVDPGKTTGVALFSWIKGSGEEPKVEWTDELSFTEFVDKVRIALNLYQSSLEIVCEKFTINVQTAKNSQAPYSLEVIGALKTLMHDAGRNPEDLQYQLPANAMNMFSNPKLKKLEYWHRGGGGHALDAIRHALLFLVKEGWNPISRLRD